MDKFWIMLILAGCLIFSGSAKGEDYNDDYVDDEEVESEELGDPEITSEAINPVVDPGEDVRFPCDGHHLSSYSVMWKHSDQIISAGEITVTPDQRFELDLKDNKQTLILRNVSNEDSGEYLCEVATSINSGNKLKVVHMLQVREPPHFLKPKSTRIVTQYDRVTLSCDVSGYPEPEVVWQRKGKKFPTGDTYVKGYELTFDKVTRKHSGVYECIAKNPLGQAITAVSLIVYHAPEIEVEKEAVNSGQNYETELVCKVYAEPKATVTWYKNGQEISSNKHERIQKVNHIYTLRMKNVNEKDYGNYSCFANNSLGVASEDILLSGAPGQPILKEAVLLDDHVSYRLVWTLESISPIYDYKVVFREIGGEFKEIPVLGKKAQEHSFTHIVEHIFEDLKPSTTYAASLSAENEYGWSHPSRMQRFHVPGAFQSHEAVDQPGATAVVGSSGNEVTVNTVSLAMLAGSSLLSTYLMISVNSRC